MSILLLIAGLGLLILSGEVLVKGAVSSALRFRISPLVIGLTVVSLGTSAPELLVCIQAALAGHADIAIGNVIGSNIANLCLVLGATVLLRPIVMTKDSMRIDWPVMMIASGLFALLILDLQFGALEGSIFTAALIIFVVLMIRRSRALNHSEADNEVPKNAWKMHWAILAVALGCIGLVFGAKWFLSGAENIARSLGVSDHLIGVTLVAFGTSIPELVTSIIAAIRKQADLSIGNLIGSNIFNILGILGLTSILSPISVNPIVLSSDIWWMLGSSFIILPMALFGKQLGRRSGVALLCIYIAYVVVVTLGDKA